MIEGRKRIQFYNTYRVTVMFPDELFLLFDNYLTEPNPLENRDIYNDRKDYNDEVRLVTVDAIVRLIHNFIHDPDFTVPDETINRIGSMILTNGSLHGWKEFIKEPVNTLTTSRIIKDITLAVDRTLTELVNTKYYLTNVIGKLQWKISRVTINSFTITYYSANGTDYQNQEV